MKDEDEKAWMANRDKKLAPKLGLFWCNWDCCKVGYGEKCKHCRTRTGKRKLKK